jgi:hypothetical protein
MEIDDELAAQLDKDERAIRIAEELARKLGKSVAVFDADGNKLWEATPTEQFDS